MQNQRINYMKSIKHWWSNIIQKHINSLNLLVLNQKFIPMEQLLQLICKILIEYKYLSHIKGGLLFCYNTMSADLQNFVIQKHQQIQKIQFINQMTKVDLTKEERIAKRWQNYRIIKTNNLDAKNKLIERNKVEVNEITIKLKIQMQSSQKELINNKQYKQYKLQQFLLLIYIFQKKRQIKNSQQNSKCLHRIEYQGCC
ncbi:unnamed protein product [Paramecium sonneborni]|uniref:Uncharacterized protein n=1 Tax=Paramecium sonneborni TaxID=65129 RepID=A0A8S1Q116_9CILI|nr:unnamed protein product [Paramecium sonneborni]